MIMMSKIYSKILNRFVGCKNHISYVLEQSYFFFN